MTDTLAATRQSLHGVAELLLAGQSYRTAGRIRLTVVPGGFITVEMPESPRLLRVERTELVVESDTGAVTRLPLEGSYRQLADRVGIACEAPQGLYTDNSGVGPDDYLEVDPEIARSLLDALTIGDSALRVFGSTHGGDDAPTPVLWPEHFDVAISLDEVNYGVSLGDGTIGEPYAYVGPWTAREGDFWNVPFGAARTLDELGSEPSGLVEFFDAGRSAAG